VSKNNDNLGGQRPHQKQKWPMSANEIIEIIEKSAANPIILLVSGRQEQNLPDNPATPPPATKNIYFQQKERRKKSEKHAHSNVT
jgi:hypothetical protein